ncbi:MAG: Uma2 family endonuclease [Methylovulum sp.]|uniref:Uma2 family endonuclease n=1 Tax=Methylovulum sp. TaxID=1916980 RepID=UPI00262275A5|nr:Uma2 family endonuclease [Methylovulum sp.]MDD2725017.1 Uma2 family endonuclease [Methylovulum sp.]MDD5126455.1 Uma2 family endonuclease [Methylovulum sp.]
MLAHTLISYLSEADYLAMEMTSQERHEYVDGAIFAMTGASRAHNQIGINLVSFLHTQVKDTRCRVYMSDVKLKIAHKKTYYYPDVMLGCSQNETDAYAVTEPCLIIEVLSPATALIDKREKLIAYQNISSVQEYCLVAQDKYRVEKYTRHQNSQGWFLDHYGKEDRVPFVCVDCEISVRDIYSGVLA